MAEDHTQGWFMRVKITYEAVLPPFTEEQTEPEQFTESFEVFVFGSCQQRTFFIYPEVPPFSEEVFSVLARELEAYALANQMLRHGFGP
jgi:hypothetical protein